MLRGYGVCVIVCDYFSSHRITGRQDPGMQLVASTASVETMSPPQANLAGALNIDIATLLYKGGPPGRGRPAKGIDKRSNIGDSRLTCFSELVRRTSG